MKFSFELFEILIERLKMKILECDFVHERFELIESIEKLLLDFEKSVEEMNLKYFSEKIVKKCSLDFEIQFDYLEFGKYD
jgi:hypothetical protein